MDRFIEMVCMNLTKLPPGNTIHPMIIDTAIQEANTRLDNGETIGSTEDSNKIAKLQVLKLYRAGPFVYCRARILEAFVPSLSYGLTCAGTVERIREVITKFSFCTISATIDPQNPLTK